MFVVICMCILIAISWGGTTYAIFKKHKVNNTKNKSV